MAAQRGADAGHADAVAEDFGLDRHLVRSRLQPRDQGRDGGWLQIEAFRVLPPPRDFHNGSFKAKVAPQDDAIAFADAGGYGDECHVRMQRIGPLLLVVDNSGCGGAGSFTGLYRRKK